MHLVFLGSASCFPTPSRGVSCTALQLDDGQIWLFDCGEGSQVQLQKSRLKPGKISKIFITHLHGDHVFGLVGLLCTLGNGGNVADKTVDMYGPLGIRKLVATNLELSRSPLAYKYNVHELIPRIDQYPSDWAEWPVELEREYPHPLEHAATKISFDESRKCWPLFSSNTMSVSAAAIRHRIPSFGFLMSERDQPGTLNVDRLKALGVQPGPMYARLKQGHDVTLDDGSVIRSGEVTGPPRRGRNVAVLGDTCDASEMEALAVGCDLLVHEATMEDALKEKAVQFGHSTPSMAAEQAVRLKAKRLCLFHVSPRYKPMSAALDEEDDKSAKVLLEEAKAALKRAEFSCDVLIAEDFMEIKL